MAALTHFDQLLARKRGFFHETFDGNDMKHQVFMKIDVFSTKYGHERGRFFRVWTFFTKNGHERNGFFLKNREKMASY